MQYLHSFSKYQGYIIMISMIGIESLKFSNKVAAEYTYMQQSCTLINRKEMKNHDGKTIHFVKSFLI